MSLPPDDEPQHKDDEIPRERLLSAFPKRAIYRVVVLLAALAGILYLRARTGTIASCMSGAFVPPGPHTSTATSPTIRASVVIPDGGGRQAR